MRSAEATQAGVLVVRVWTEPGMPELRARLIEARDLDDVQTQATVAGVDGICDAVRAWLESIAGRIGRDAVVTDR